MDSGHINSENYMTLLPPSTQSSYEYTEDYLYIHGGACETWTFPVNSNYSVSNAKKSMKYGQTHNNRKL